MSTDARLTTLEHAMADLAVAQARTQANLDRLSDEMRSFKDEMRTFKEEMRSFKDEMRTFKDEMGAFKDEMGVFKAEMGAFKDEMRVFKDDVRVYIEEMRADREAIRADREAAGAQLAAFQAEMRRGQAEMRRSYGELSASLGTLAEDIVAPGLPEAFKSVFGVEPTASVVRSSFRHPQLPGESQEFDVVAWGGGYFLVNETRKRARPEDIPVVLDLLAKVRLYYPQAEAMKVVGSLASLYVDPSLVKGAERQGLLVFGLGGGLLEILNSPGFRPREH